MATATTHPTPQPAAAYGKDFLPLNGTDHVSEEFAARIDPDQLHAIGRMAGATYARTTDRFEMERPK